MRAPLPSASAPRGPWATRPPRHTHTHTRVGSDTELAPSHTVWPRPRGPNVFEIKHLPAPDKWHGFR